MWLVSAATLLAALAANALAPTDQEPAVTFHSAKSLASLQKCLTDKLADVGEVVAVRSDADTTTLVLRNIPDGPMTIDLAPPKVTVTSKLTPHTRHLQSTVARSNATSIGLPAILGQTRFPRVATSVPFILLLRLCPTRWRS